MNLAKQVRIASFHLTSSFHHCQQQQQSKELSLGEDDIETLENEGVDDEAGDNDEVRSRQDGGWCQKCMKFRTGQYFPMFCLSLKAYGEKYFFLQKKLLFFYKKE